MPSSGKISTSSACWVDHGAPKDEDAFYHACEQSNPALLDLLHQPGFEALVNHKLDFEDADGLRWSSTAAST